MKALVAATFVMLAPALASAHQPFDTRITARRHDLPRVHSGSGHAGGVTQPEKYDPPKQSANDPKAAASHGS